MGGAEAIGPGTGPPVEPGGQAGSVGAGERATPAGASFGERLRSFRARAGVSQRALARASGVNPAIVSRLEADDRGPSGPDQVHALARALGLHADDLDALLAAAGFWPRAVLTLGPSDPTLVGVARVLAGSSVPRAQRDRFRRVLDLLLAQWLGS